MLSLCTGFHDTSLDADIPKVDFHAIRLSEVDEEDKRQKERIARRDDKDKISKRKQDDLPSYLLGNNAYDSELMHVRSTSLFDDDLIINDQVTDSLW